MANLQYSRPSFQWFTCGTGLSRAIHLSFDIDGLDPLHAPSTGTLAQVHVLGGICFLVDSPRVRDRAHMCETTGWFVFA
jgi:hypothetical protein